MAKFFDQIEPHVVNFIAAQHIFFTATAAPNGRVNISPRPSLCFRVLNPNAVAYLDETGSGNETAAHLRQLDRMTIMFCGFEAAPLILRLYGHGRTHPVGSPEFEALLKSDFGGEASPGARQIVRLTVELRADKLRLRRAAVRLQGGAEHAASLGRGQGAGRTGGLPAGEEPLQHRRLPHRLPAEIPAGIPQAQPLAAE